MSYLIACTHCQRLFLPETSNHLCPSCAPGYAQLQAECAVMPDPTGAMAGAMSSLRGLKRFRDLQPPKNFHDLLPWLAVHPRVRITGPTAPNEEPTTRDEAFLTYRNGLLWFRGADGLSHIPISGRRIEVTAQSKTPISFDSIGFTIFRFGAHIRVEYQP